MSPAEIMPIRLWLSSEAAAGSADAKLALAAIDSLLQERDRLRGVVEACDKRIVDLERINICIVPCTLCGAPSGKPCTTNRYEDHAEYGLGRTRLPHPQRIDAAKVRGCV
jgi:hypothetical protein